MENQRNHLLTVAYYCQGKVNNVSSFFMFYGRFCLINVWLLEMRNGINYLYYLRAKCSWVYSLYTTTWCEFTSLLFLVSG